MILSIGVGIVLIYVALILKVAIRLRPFKTTFKLSDNKLEAFSIIIPLRNEIKNLPALIQNLKSIDYPRSHFEIILINDHSTDESEPWLTHHPDLVPNAKVISLPQHLTGKKAAIKYGATQANFNQLVFLDADCEVSKNHLSILNNVINNNPAEVVYGSVLLKSSKSLVSQFDYLENLLLQGFTAYGFLIKNPFLANGANWSVKKDVFLQHQYNPNEGPGGDDVFFLHQTKNKFCLTYEPNWRVYTIAHENFKDFINQKLRWAYKWKKYIDKTTLLLGLIFWSGQTGFLLIILLLFFSKKISTLACLAVGLKLVSEWFLGKKCSRFFNQPAGTLQLLVFYITYPIFTLLMAPFSALAKYSWKDRKYN